MKEPLASININSICVFLNSQKGNETPRPEQPEQTEVSNPVSQVPEELTRVTKYRTPDLVVDGPETTETIKPYTSVKCAKEAKEVRIIIEHHPHIFK